MEAKETERLITVGQAIEIVGYVSAELADRSGAWDGIAPPWFPEPPEWLELFEKALRASDDQSLEGCGLIPLSEPPHTRGQQ